MTTHAREGEVSATGNLPHGVESACASGVTARWGCDKQLPLVASGLGWATSRQRAGGCQASAGRQRTSLLVQLLQNLTNDLPDALQRLEIIFGLVVLLLQGFDVVAHCERNRTVCA